METLGQNNDAPADPFGFDSLKDLNDGRSALKVNLPSTPRSEFAKDASHNFTRNIADFIDIKPETLRLYRTDKFAQNIDRLESYKKPYLAEVYRNLMLENPKLRNITIVDQGDIPNACFAPAMTYGLKKQVIPSVVFNLSHTESFLHPEYLNTEDGLGLEYVLKTIAIKTGARPSEMLKNERLVASFVMAHEFGHALDFEKNYLAPEQKKFGGTKGLPSSIIRSINRFRRNRLRDLMTQPIPGQVEASSTFERVVHFSKRLRAMGVDPKDSSDITSSIQKSYRKMSSESFADDFATDYIMRHYGDFFVKTGESSPEKISTHIGELINVNDDLDLFSFDSGKSFSLTPVQLERNPDNGHTRILPASTLGAKKTEGFLSQKLAVGRPLRLLKQGSPTSRDFVEFPPPENIFIRPRRNKNGKVINDTIVQFGVENPSVPNALPPSYFILESTGREPREENVSPKELLNAMMLEKGSKVLLMKRDQRARSGLRLGGLLGGRLETAYDYDGSDGAPIKKGYGIHLAQTTGEKTVDGLIDPDFMCGGVTTKVKRAYRKWHSYFVQTETSTYEVIPYT